MRSKLSFSAAIAIGIVLCSFASLSLQTEPDSIFTLRRRDEASAQTFQKCPPDAYTKAQQCMQHVNDLEGKLPGGPCKDDDVKCHCTKVQGLADCSKDCPHLLQGAASAYATSNCRGQKNGIKIKAFGGDLTFTWGDQSSSQQSYPKPQSGGKNESTGSGETGKNETTPATTSGNNATNSTTPASPVDSNPSNATNTTEPTAANASATNASTVIGPTTPTNASAPTVSQHTVNASCAQAQIGVYTVIAFASLALLSYYL